MAEETSTTEDLLQQELKKLKKQIAGLEKSLEEKPDYGLGQGDPEITRWEMNRALLEQLKEHASRIEEAIESGEQYGICERCQQPIHPDRLAVLPDTRLCVECARSEE